MSLVFLVTATFLTLAAAEWVEISQQHHYKKPIKPTHNHPLLSIGDNDRNNGNRIYANQTVQGTNWSADLTAKPNRNRVKNDDIRFQDSDNKRLDDGGAKIKADVLVIRKPKPEAKRKEHLNNKRITAAGNVIRVRPVANTESSKKRPFEDFKHHDIEVLNLSDLEITGEDSRLAEYEQEQDKINRKNNVPLNTTPTSTRGKETSRFAEKPRSTTTAPKHRKQGTKGTVLLKGNNMRRVEILAGKKQLTTNNPIELEQEEDVGSTVQKFPTIGHVKRVQLNASAVGSSNKLKPDINRYSSTELYLQHDFTETIRNQNPTTKTTALQRGTTERAFPLKNKVKSEKTRFDNFELVSHEKNPEDIMIEELLNDAEDIKVHKIASIGTVKRVSPIEAAKINRRIDGPRPLTKATIEAETDGEVIVEDEETIDLHDKTYRNPAFETDTEPVLTAVKYKHIKHPVTKRPNVDTQIEKLESNPYRHIIPSREPLPEFVTKEEDFDEDTRFDENYRTTKVTTERSVKRKVVTESYRRETTTEKTRVLNKPQKPQSNKNTYQKPEEDPSNDSKASSMENLIKFLKTVTDIITRNTRRGVQSKMRYLEDLRDSILANIEQRIEAAFPDDDAPGSKRKTRSTSEPRGHVEFPSSESALMTISFLTFAVYLIKLVLQVIQAHKNKAMMVLPTMVAAVGKVINERQSKSGN